MKLSDREKNTLKCLIDSVNKAVDSVEADPVAEMMRHRLCIKGMFKNFVQNESEYESFALFLDLIRLYADNGKLWQGIFKEGEEDLREKISELKTLLAKMRLVK
jgi:5'-deoxynucleotidase YfbR-like HD superfamily hydrolase